MEENKQQLNSEEPTFKEKIQILLSDFDKKDELFEKGELKIEGKDKPDYIEDVCKPIFLKIFRLTVPSSGKSNTKLGEIARCINKLWYRYENDGDIYFAGAGRETVGCFASYLGFCKIQGINDIMREKRYIHNIECKNDYMKFLGDLMKEFLLGITDDNLDYLLGDTDDSAGYPESYNLIKERATITKQYVIVPVKNPDMVMKHDDKYELIDPCDPYNDGDFKTFDSPKDAFDYIDNNLSDDQYNYYAVRSIYQENWMACSAWDEDSVINDAEREVVRMCNDED